MTSRQGRAEAIRLRKMRAKPMATTRAKETARGKALGKTTGTTAAKIKGKDSGNGKDSGWRQQNAVRQATTCMSESPIQQHAFSNWPQGLWMYECLQNIHIQHTFPIHHYPSPSVSLYIIHDTSYSIYLIIIHHTYIIQSPQTKPVRFLVSPAQTCSFPGLPSTNLFVSWSPHSKPVRFLLLRC